MKNLNNIIERAANLIISGEATKDNALQMAIEIDNNKCEEVIFDVKSMRDYPNAHNLNQKAFYIIMNGVYTKLS